MAASKGHMKEKCAIRLTVVAATCTRDHRRVSYARIERFDEAKYSRLS